MQKQHNPKTAAERKAVERQRRKDAGQVLVQEWVHESMAAKLKAYAAKLRGKSLQPTD